MMASQAPIRIFGARAEVACVAAAGCRYLRALSMIERIAGFEHTARSYAAAATRCRDEGCSAANEVDAAAASAPTPIPLASVRRPASESEPSSTARTGQMFPFSRSALIDIATDQNGNYVERRALKLESLPVRGDPLGYLYRYWLDLRSASALQFSNIDTVHLARAGVIGKLHVVDVNSSDPQDFTFELFGYAVPLNRYEKPRAIPVPIYADTTMRDYNTVRLTAKPCLHRIRCRIGDTSHHYTRLILPFLGKGGRVTRLAVAIRQEPGSGVKVEVRH
jgi:hypothetical protein